MEFKFLNTKIDLYSIKEGIKIDSNNQFLKSYDKNNNSIFDNEELSKLYSDLEPLINDGELDKNESISLLAKVLNTSVESIKQRFATQETNDVFEGLETIYSKSIQKDVLDHKTSEISQALKLYEQARGGKVSDTIHEIFNPDYISDKVYRQLAREQVSVLLLHDAEGGNLTMKNYLERKVEFLECYLGKDKLNEKDKEFLNKGIRQLTPQELNNLIDKLTDCDDNEFQQIVNQTLSDLKNKGEKASNPNNSREIGFKTSNPNSIESILNSSDSEKVVDYENTFKIEYGLEFNEEQVQNYLDKKSEFETVSRIHNKIATQYNSLDEAIKSNNSEDLKESIRNALTTLCGNNPEKKDQLLSNLGYSNLESLDNEQLKKLAQDFQKELKTTLDKQLNGKTIEQYIEELEKAESLAYGDKMNIKVVEKYAELTEKAVNNVKMAVSGVGFIATFAGGPMVLVGLGISALGGAGVSFVEESTKGETIPEDKQKEILNELVTSGLLTASSFGSGIASTALRNLVATKCPKIIAAITEYGSDTVMSLLSDYAITGQVDLTAEGISQLLNIATGINASNKIRKPKNNADAEVKVRNNTDADVNTKNSTETYTKINTENSKMASRILKDMTKDELDTYIRNLAKNSTSSFSENELKDLVDNIFNLKKINKKLLNDIDNSQIFKLIETGKLDFDCLKNINFKDKRARISRNMIEDYKKIANNEPQIKTFETNTNSSKILSETLNGEVIEVGNKLFLNDNGSLIEIHLTKEKYLELFPPAKRFDIKQNESKYAGNCWFLETTCGLYNNDSTRNQILKLFRQEGNDVFVKLPNSDIEVKFNKGNLPNDKMASQYLSDSPKWMQMLEYVTAFTRGDDSIEKRVLSNLNSYKQQGVVKEKNGQLIFDMNKYYELSDNNAMLSRLYGGTAKEATEIITNSNNITEYNIHALKFDSKDKKALKQMQKEIKEKLYSLEGKSGYSINTAITCHAYSVSRIENGKIFLTDPYNTSIEIEFDIDDFVENYCNHLEISKFVERPNVNTKEKIETETPTKNNLSTTDNKFFEIESNGNTRYIEFKQELTPTQIKQLNFFMSKVDNIPLIEDMNIVLYYGGMMDHNNPVGQLERLYNFAKKYPKTDMADLLDGKLYLGQDINIKHYEEINNAINGPKPQYITNAINNFEQKNNVKLYLDNNLNEDQIANIIKKIEFSLNNYKKTNRDIPKEIYITSLGMKNNDGYFIDTPENNINKSNFVVLSSKNIDKLDDIFNHETVHLANMNHRKDGLKGMTVGETIGIKNGNITKFYDQQYIERVSILTKTYISNYSNTSVDEFIAEFGSMILKGNIIVEDFDKRIFKFKEPFTNLDGVTIELTDSSKKELEELIIYYFEVGGQNFSLN